MEIISKQIFEVLRRTSTPVQLDGRYPAAACFKNLNLVDIPEVLEKKGYTVAAALMRRWFVGRPFYMPVAWKKSGPSRVDYRTLPQPHVDTSIVKMQWALRYGRVVTKYQELRSAVLGYSSVRSLHASQDELFKSLKKAQKFTDRPMRFGQWSITPLDLHETALLNTRKISANALDKLADPIDDLYCALGAFNLNVAASGTVTPLAQAAGGGPTHRVHIERLGFYLLDFYDFNGYQPLGYWGLDEIRRIPSHRHVMVENASFRRWRALHDRGGDFVIFSDVHWEAAPRELIWDYVPR